MKFFTLSVLICCLSVFANGDILRLRNGTEFTGHYIGGTTTEIWFQRDGMVSTTEVIPTSLVEALKFEPGAVNPAAARGPASKTWLAYFRAVFATAWFPYTSSARTATVTSPGGTVGRIMR
jgi:hypothetical protein